MTDMRNLYNLYLKKVYGESPYLEPHDLGASELNDWSFNLEWSSTEGVKIPIIKELTHSSRIICIHETIDGVYKDHYFISKNNPFTFATLSLKQFKDTNGVQIVNVWNHPIHGKGIARWAIFEYYLKIYPFIVSDKAQTNAGKNHWEKLITEALARHYKVSVLFKDNEQEIFSAEESEDYYFNSQPGHYLFKISNR